MKIEFVWSSLYEGWKQVSFSDKRKKMKGVEMGSLVVLTQLAPMNSLLSHFPASNNCAQQMTSASQASCLMHAAPWFDPAHPRCRLCFHLLPAEGPQASSDLLRAVICWELDLARGFPTCHRTEPQPSPALWAATCNPASLVRPPLLCCRNPPVEHRLWAGKNECGCPYSLHDVPFKRCCISPPHSLPQLHKPCILRHILSLQTAELITDRTETATGKLHPQIITVP